MTPFALNVPEAELDDLRKRLALTRWPEQETVSDWSQGVPLRQARALIDYWQSRYDWRRCETMLNGFGQFKTTIDGLDLHFLHVRSPHPGALPLIITHGWPGSVIEFHKVIRPLTDPVAYGGAAADAFDVIAPSLPGYGFSGKPAEPGWGVERIAETWIKLIERLGYDKYVAQGGDWGAGVTTAMARRKPEGLLAIHLNMVVVPPHFADETLTAAERAAVDGWKRFIDVETGYSRQQSTRPQTLGYGLADSPAGQALWIYEKFKAWTDCTDSPEDALTRDELLDNIMMYWLSNSGASSARLYWESFGSLNSKPFDLPTGCSLFHKEIIRPPRHWADEIYRRIIHWNELPKGGHFAAFEQPELFVTELRNCFRQLR